jgi:hypothetical protein
MLIGSISLDPVLSSPPTPLGIQDRGGESDGRGR